MSNMDNVVDQIEEWGKFKPFKKVDERMLFEGNCFYWKTELGKRLLFRRMPPPPGEEIGLMIASPKIWVIQADFFEHKLRRWFLIESKMFSRMMGKKCYQLPRNTAGNLLGVIVKDGEMAHIEIANEGENPVEIYCEYSGLAFNNVVGWEKHNGEDENENITIYYRQDDRNTPHRTFLNE